MLTVKGGERGSVCGESEGDEDAGGGEGDNEASSSEHAAGRLYAMPPIVRCELVSLYVGYLATKNHTVSPHSIRGSCGRVPSFTKRVMGFARVGLIDLVHNSVHWYPRLDSPSRHNYVCCAGQEVSLTELDTLCTAPDRIIGCVVRVTPIFSS